MVHNEHGNFNKIVHDNILAQSMNIRQKCLTHFFSHWSLFFRKQITSENLYLYHNTATTGGLKLYDSYINDSATRLTITAKNMEQVGILNRKIGIEDTLNAQWR